MMRAALAFFLNLLLAPLLASQSFAGEVPEFLANGQKYATDVKACTAEGGDESEALVLSASGIAGYEFGCNFLQFLDVKDDTDGGAYQFLAISVCGDDSGVNRGDMITLTPSIDDQVLVTSQNDYALQQSRGDSSDGEETLLIEEGFTRCPN